MSMTTTPPPPPPQGMKITRDFGVTSDGETAGREGAPRSASVSGTPLVGARG